MHYIETKEQSHEFLRLALPLMSKQMAAAHPISYAVWYEYVSGMNAALKRDLDARQLAGQLLNDAQTVELFRKHVADVDEGALNRLQLELHRLLSEVAQSAKDSHQQTADYGATLDEFSQALSTRRQERPDDPLQQTLRLVAQQTFQIKATIATLQQEFYRSRSEVEQLRRELEHMREEVHTDVLSGLLNRKGFDETLHELLNQANEEQLSLCLVLLDIDDFKRVNDNYGHLFGDRVIRAVGQVLKTNTKGRDVAARYGGEEFALLLPQTPVAGARALAEEIRGVIEKASIHRQDSAQTVGKITLSAGVSLYHLGEPADNFICRADEALYASKKQGKNRVTVGEPA
jgi:diguanylate cyclase